MRTAAVGLLGGDDVQKQAILGCARRAIRRGNLRAVRTELAGVEDSLPARVRLRWAPPKVTDRRRGVGNAEKRLHLTLRHAPDGPVIRTDNLGFRGRRRERRSAGDHTCENRSHKDVAGPAWRHLSSLLEWSSRVSAHAMSRPATRQGRSGRARAQTSGVWQKPDDSLCWAAPPNRLARRPASGAGDPTH